MEFDKSRMFQNANKVAFLVQQWPEESLIEKVIEKLEMPGVNINSSLWYAEELGYIKTPEAEAKIELGPNVPALDKWDFGPEIQALESMMLYSFQRLAEKEADLEEIYFNNWMAGHSVLVINIARQHLLALNLLAEYSLEDGDSTYTFFTLYENRDKLWGRKQFKTDPLSENEPTEDDNEAPAAPQEEE